jgi:hypothetical protein
MHRRTFFEWITMLLCGSTLVRTASGQDADVTDMVLHMHEWVEGPFYLKVAVTGEEPDWYAPVGLLAVEHCLTCGVVRLPREYWNKTGKNLGGAIR